MPRNPAVRDGVIEPPPTLAGALRRAIVRGAVLGVLLAPWPLFLSFFSRYPARTSFNAIVGWRFGGNLTFATPVACLILFLVGFTETPVALVELTAARGARSWLRHLLAVAAGVSVGVVGLGLLMAWGSYLADLGATRSVEHSMGEIHWLFQRLWQSDGIFEVLRLFPLVVPIALASYTRLRRVGIRSEVFLGAAGSLGFFVLAFVVIAGGILREPYRLAFLTTLAGALLPLVIERADALDAWIVERLTPEPED